MQRCEKSRKIHSIQMTARWSGFLLHKSAFDFHLPSQPIGQLPMRTNPVNFGSIEKTMQISTQDLGFISTFILPLCLNLWKLSASTGLTIKVQFINWMHVKFFCSTCHCRAAHPLSPYCTRFWPRLTCCLNEEQQKSQWQRRHDHGHQVSMVSRPSIVGNCWRPGGAPTYSSSSSASVSGSTRWYRVC